MILAFDVSGSMAADDLAPTRMEAAKAAARTFVAAPAADACGSASSPSATAASRSRRRRTTRPTVLAAIDRLDAAARHLARPAASSRRSTTIAAADAGPAADYYTNRSPEPTADADAGARTGTYAPAVIVLLTDGENNEQPDPLAAAQAAADRGVRIYTVGIGSAAGTTLDIDGFRVHTQLDEATLQQIADADRRHLLRRRRRAGRSSAIYDDLDTAAGRSSRGDRGHLAVRRAPASCCVADSVGWAARLRWPGSRDGCR